MAWRSRACVTAATVSLLMLMLGIMIAPGAAADWPTYRGDSRRGGASAEELKLPLQAVWIHQALHAPQPAWPELPAGMDVWHRIHGLAPTTTYDRAFHAVTSGDALYFGSSADDAIHCHDAASGALRWSFVTEGPVRLAPTISGGKVYAGSDDGCVYCLDAADGKLVWRYRVGPEDRRLPGNGRVISLWPVRCGIVVEDGSVWVGAGLFPDQGAYLCALGAADGKEIWKQQVKASLQGYLWASPTRLFVPTGRTPPQAYQRADGKELGELPGSGVDNRAGGCFGLLLDDAVVHSSGEGGGIHFTSPDSGETVVFTAGLRLIAKGPVAYILTKNRLLALDRAAYRDHVRARQNKEKAKPQRKPPAELDREVRPWIKWDIACPTTHEIILAGDTIFAGRDSQVVAYNAADGKQLWSAVVLGKAYGLAVSNGALFASTDKGAIYCFKNVKDQEPAVISVEAVRKAAPYSDGPQADACQRAAEAALAAAGTGKGYCLVLGAGSGRLAFEIARRSQFQVVGLEPDAQKAIAARKLLSQSAFYGARVSIHHGSLDKLPYPKYFANLIVSEEAATTGKLPFSAAEVFRVLRPHGGAVVLAQPSGTAGATSLENWGKAAIPGWKVTDGPGGAPTGTARRGPLEGAGEWSHFYADPGNSACSQDRVKQGPVDVQWFGRPGPQRMVDRHDKNVGPVYAGGRLFVSGNNYVAALDAYNGTILWEQDVPESVRLGAFKHCGSMAATSERLYIASGSDCLALDAQTGRRKLVLSTPPAADGSRNQWGYVAAVDDLLLGSDSKPEAAFRIQDLDTETLIWRDFMPVVCSDSLFAHQQRSGQKLWTYTPPSGVIINPTIAVAGARVFFVESDNPDTRAVADGRITLKMLLGKGSHLVALDMRTGKVLWKQSPRLDALQHIIYLSCAQDVLLVSGTKNVLVDKKGRVRYDLFAFDAATGAALWQNTQTPIPDHILQGGHGEQVQHPAIVGGVIYGNGFACQLRTGEPIDGWRWQKSNHCGTLSTSALCAFSRYSNPRIFDLQTGQYNILTEVARPGCWINVIPAGGLIMMPEASAGCICGYPLQASLALAPRENTP